jgi:hypothetical protein
MADTANHHAIDHVDFLDRATRDATVLALVVLDSHMKTFIDKICRKGSVALTDKELFDFRSHAIRGLDVPKALLDRAALDPREDHPYACAKRLLSETQKAQTLAYRRSAVTP